MKMFKQVREPLAYVKERAYPKTVAQGGDDEIYSELQFRIDETIFAAYEKAEMRKAKRGEPITVEAAVWPATKDILESMCDIMDVLKEGGFQKITPKPVFMLFPGHTHLPDGLKLAYAMIALLSEGK